MRLLLDTNALIWSMTASRHLPAAIKRLILSRDNTIAFSVVSIAEIAAKRASGSRSAPRLAAEEAVALAHRAGYDELVVTAEHAAAIETIAPFHGDPFDRLLLAQAQVEGMRLLTADEALAAYDSRTILF